MDITFGIVMITFGLLAWGGQTISWLAPEPARRTGLAEHRSDVDRAFWARSAIAVVTILASAAALD